MFRFDYVLIALILAASIFATTGQVCRHLDHKQQQWIDLDVWKATS